MASLYRRVQHVRTKYRKSDLTTDQLCDLGRIVIDKYWQFKDETTPVIHKEYPEEPGMKVIDYPRIFIPEIDKIVTEYYRNLIQKRPLRQRKLVKTPVGYGRKTTH